ncbi:SRPBCC family protein [Halobacillus yeomjeoni]|uniref:SRPBCC family protein n=1 Tax=Halobacillus yeomjeoni TaxID=311194 RepID=A0A931MUW2_9BACI|nr:SRPBCC family protein [Halobacillus yeomjeoni]MBH0230398.1 SRPBCC family protein [Halobacillus yeomjeoni]
MSFINKTVIIRKPIEEVFDEATNFKNGPEVMDNVIDVEILTEGPVREGFQFKETREIRGRKASAIIEITDYKHNKSYTARSEQNGIDLRYHYSFTETTEGTRVDFEGELITKGLRNTLTKPLIQMIIKKEDEKHLDHLKKHIETVPSE